ncbi:MAG TPA: hypothetical protein VHB45_13105 [Alloacidobacterium sp.]|nr:hypothetical protein [Alloacidobacterium sp.]
MGNLQAVPSLSTAGAEDFWCNGRDAVATAAGEQPETLQQISATEDAPASAETSERSADRPGPRPGLSVRSRQGATVSESPMQHGDLVGGEKARTATFTERILFFLDTFDFGSRPLVASSEGGAQ